MQANRAITHDSEFVSARVLARRWCCSISTVRRILRRANVPAYHFGDAPNSPVRYRVRDVDKFVATLEEDIT